MHTFSVFGGQLETIPQKELTEREPGDLYALQDANQLELFTGKRQRHSEALKPGIRTWDI